MALLSGDVNVPGVGKVPKLLAYGSVAGVGVLAIIWYRNHRAAGAAAASGASAAAVAPGNDPYPADGTTGNPDDPYSTDPATGQTYGDESVGYTSGGQDTGATGDAFPWDGTTGNPNDPYSMDPSTGSTYGDEGDESGGGGGGTNSGPGTFVTNAAWSQYAQAYLTGTVGLDPATVSAALGAYINGQPVTTAQQSIINQAIAYANAPPVTGPNGFPPSMNVTGSSGGGGQGTKPAPPAGLALTVKATTITATWKPVASATSYTFECTPKDTAAHNIGNRTSYSAGGLKAGTSYTVHVAASNAAGTSSAVTKSIKTPAAAKKK